MINYSDYEVAVAIIDINDKAQAQRKTLPSALNELQVKTFIDTQFYLRHREIYKDMNEQQKITFGSGSLDEILESAKSYILVYDMNEKLESDLKSKEDQKNKNKI